MNTEAKLTQVRAAHRFDEASLAEYLKPQLDGFCEPLGILQFEGGQSNPTFLLDCGDHQFVLRKKPPGIQAYLSPKWSFSVKTRRSSERRFS